MPSQALIDGACFVGKLMLVIRSITSVVFAGWEGEGVAALVGFSKGAEAAYEAVEVKAEPDDNEVDAIDAMFVVVVDFFTAKNSIDFSCFLLLLARKLFSNLVND